MKATINDEIVSVATSYVGQEEVLGNQGFKTPAFQTKMEAVGFQLGFAWCALLAELIWKEAYQQWDATLFSRLDKLFSASAVSTFRNFQKTKDFITNQKPVAGALAVWQTYKSGKPSWTGHVGIVKEFSISKGTITTIEGNSNDKGGREGYIVAEQHRTIDLSVKQNGLVLIGFVHPKEI